MILGIDVQVGAFDGLLKHDGRQVHRVHAPRGEAAQAPPDAFVDSGLAAGTGDLREILTELATRMLELGRIAIPIMMMSWSNPEGEYSLEKMVSRGEGYRVACGSIQGFFEREIERGRMANVDPQVLTRVFMGSLHHYCMSQFFLVNQGPLAIPPEVYVQGLVDLVMRASAPHEAPPRTKLERL